MKTLLDGQSRVTRGTYAKWQGRHWVLAALADLGYPEGDPALTPIVRKMLATWLDPKYFREGFRIQRGGHPGRQSRASMAATGDARPSRAAPCCRRAARPRRAGSLGWWSACCTGNGRTGAGTARPSRRPGVPRCTRLFCRCGDWRAYARAFEDTVAMEAARNAAEVFLERRMLFHRTNGRLIRREWAELHYPVYWHYDVLAGLKGLMEVGLIADGRTAGRPRSAGEQAVAAGRLARRCALRQKCRGGAGTGTPGVGAGRPPAS